MSSTPMDIFSSDLAIPFEVAAYCRGHKLCVQTVGLSRALKAREVLYKQRDEAETILRAAEQQVEEAIGAVYAKMEREPI